MLKKLISVTLIILMLSVTAGCRVEEHTYVISNATCSMLFSHLPEEWEEVANISYWVQGEYVSADVDEEGNLVLVLNDKHIAHFEGDVYTANAGLVYTANAGLTY